MEYKTRIADTILANMLEYCGAVEIRGPKWCGKSTTAERHANSVVYMQDLGTKEKNVLLAKNAPHIFLSGETPRLIDEWQEVAFIRDQIRFEVDKRSQMGQFILTGSATPLDDNAYSHSGIGRIIPMRMRPMTLFESGDGSGQVSLKELFEGEPVLGFVNETSLEDYAYLVCRGGWPGIFSVSKEHALRLHENFYEGLIHEDINKVFKNKKNPERLKRVMRAYARAESTETSMESLTEDIRANEGRSIDIRTTASYIEALQRLYVVEEMPAWNPNLRSKTAIRSANTRHFVDPSIACAALEIGPEDLMYDMKTFGLLFESMCVRDLRVYAELLGGTVYHYRDKDGLEADAVIHLKNGKWGAIEVKLRSEDSISEGARHLRMLANKINTEKMKAPSFLMVVTTTEFAYRREDGVYVAPLGCLAP
ncbi:MAG: ATP-binding protein [Acidaminococcaceae bacterium]|nr:ATP-binding protein [Acidaminococcaceae bacterium]